MTSLKQEMRQMFEKHCSMAFYENNSGFEEGLLEKIMNLAYANLSPYSTKRWSITAIKSPVLLQKLYKAAANEIKITESAIALIVCEAIEQKHETNSEPDSPHKNDNTQQDHIQKDQRDLELLALSIGYAAKYYCIDYFLVKAFDIESLSREFVLDRKQPPVAIICLGCFREELTSCTPSIKNSYSDTVKFL